MTENFYYPSFLNRDRLVHILDPDAATCEALSVLFRLEGFQTAFSVDVAGFLLAIERRRPDVALINVHIGNDSGLDVLRQIKSMRNGAPVFMLEDQSGGRFRSGGDEGRCGRCHRQADQYR